MQRASYLCQVLKRGTPRNGCSDTVRQALHDPGVRNRIEPHGDHSPCVASWCVWLDRGGLDLASVRAPILVCSASLKVGRKRGRGSTVTMMHSVGC